MCRWVWGARQSIIHLAEAKAFAVMHGAAALQKSFGTEQNDLRRWVIFFCQWRLETMCKRSLMKMSLLLPPSSLCHILLQLICMLDKSLQWLEHQPIAAVYNVTVLWELRNLASNKRLQPLCQPAISDYFRPVPSWFKLYYNIELHMTFIFIFSVVSIFDCSIHCISHIQTFLIYIWTQKKEAAQWGSDNWGVTVYNNI